MNFIEICVLRLKKLTKEMKTTHLKMLENPALGSDWAPNFSLVEVTVALKVLIT